MAVYPTNPAAGTKVGANLCTRPTFPDVNKGAWSHGTVAPREVHENGVPTGIFVNRMVFPTRTEIQLPGVVIGQSPAPVSGSWERFIHFKITMKAATSPAAEQINACGVVPLGITYTNDGDALNYEEAIPEDGGYHWITVERSLHVDVDGGASGPGWQEFAGTPVVFYLKTTSSQLGLHFVRVDWRDSPVPDYFDGATPGNSFENYAWDGTPYLSTSRATVVSVRDIAAPSTPAGLIVTGQTTTTIDLDWQTATDNVGVTGYDVYEEKQDALGHPFDVKLTATPIVQTAYTVTGLTPNTAHTFYVKALDAARNESPKTQSVTGITLSGDTTPPAAPTGLNSPSKTHNTVNLAWTAATDNIGVTGYNVYSDAVGKCRDMPITQTTYTATAASADITSSTTYNFHVKALDAAGNESVASNVVNVITPVTPPPDTTPPTAPTTLAVVGKTHDTLTLDWNAATDNVGVTGYNVYSGATKLTTTPVTTTNYTATGLTPETAYTFTATALDAAGNESAHSNTAGDTTTVAPPPPDTTPPSAPPELFVTATTTTTADLLWWPSSDNVGVTGYNVYVGEFKFTATPVTENTHTVTGLTPQQIYTFTVTAVDEAGNESEHSPATLARTAVDDSPWGIHGTLTDTLAPRVAAYVGRLNHAETITAATEYVPVVTEYVRAYTRGRGFIDNMPAGPLQVVIVAAAARLVANPEQVSMYQTGDYTERPAVLNGYTLAETAVLRRYRRISA